MTLSAAFAVAAIACGQSGGTHRRAEPTSTAVSSPPAARAPEIVELPPREEDVPGECTVDPPEGGLLDRSSVVFRRIEVRKTEMHIEERAEFRDASHTTEVVASTGGCAHLGTAYRFVVRDARPLTDRAHYLERAAGLLELLPLARTDRDFRDDIVKTIRERSDDDCTYLANEITTVTCTIEQLAPGLVSVQLIYDIAL